MNEPIMNEILPQLNIITRRYCDAGIHSGLFYVQLNGYLTTEQIEYLDKLALAKGQSE